MFRQLIKQRDRTCLISQTHHCECDAAHIIPASICGRYSPSFLEDRRNGLLLSKNFHALYDQWLWTFDIYDMQYDPIKQRYQCRLIIDATHPHLSIRQYRDQYIEIPIETYPFLYTHYQRFIAYHFNLSSDFDTFYREMINEDRVFQYLLTHPLPLEAILNHQLREFLMQAKILQHRGSPDRYYVNAILKHHNDQYLVWWDHLPLTEACWEPRNHLTSKSIQEYQQVIEKRQDDDYIR